MSDRLCPICGDQYEDNGSNRVCEDSFCRDIYETWVKPYEEKDSTASDRKTTP